MSVLENINIHDGSGNTLTSTSNALDVNIKTATGPVTVVQGNGGNLHTVVDSGTVVATQPTAADLNATVRAQDGAGNALSSTGNALDSNLKTIGGTAVQTGTGTSGAGVPRVTVADDSKVQPWDGTNSAKFDATGETTADITRFGGSPVLIGQTIMAHSMPVVIASDQEIAVSGVFSSQTGTVNSGVVPNALNGILNIVNDDFIWSSLVLNFVAPPPNSSPSLSLGGTFQLEGSIDNNTWTALTGTLLSDTPEQVTQYTTTGFLTCSARYNLAGFPWIRLRTTQPFTGTINVQQCLTTGMGDEVGFTTSRIVDDSGNSVDLTPATQYTEGQSPQAIYFQGGQTTLPTFPETTQVALTADAVYVLPKRSQIGNTLVVAVVIQGTGLTAANLAPMCLVDTAGASYTRAQLYDSTVTSAGQAIAFYVRTITAVDNEGQIGLMLGFNGLVSGGNITVTGINILVHEYSGVVVTGDSFAHVMTAALAGGEVSAPIAPYPGYLIYSLVSSQTNGFLSMNRLSTGPYTGAAPYPVECCTGDNVAQFYGLNTPWDWGCAKLPIATTGTVMMGRLIGGTGDGQIQPIKIDPASGGVLAAVTNDPLSPLSVSVIGAVPFTSQGTQFPVQLEDGSNNPISSTSGSLNVNVTGGNPIPVEQSGTWSITATDGSVGTVGHAIPTQATLIGAAQSGGGLAELAADENGNLKVNIAAGTGLTVDNASVATAGTAVPSDATYIGFNNGGDLVGVSSANPLPTATVIVGTPAVTVASGTVGLATGTAVQLSGTALGSTLDAAPNAAAPSHVLQVGGVYESTPPTVGSGNITPLQTDENGNLKVNIAVGSLGAGAVASFVPNTATYMGFNDGGELFGVSSTSPLPVSLISSATPATTQYASGTAVPTPTGTVALGTDGTDVRALSTTSTGALNVNITGGSASGTQYLSGVAVATPTGTVALGTDGTDVRALQTDGNGSLKVSLAGSSVTPVVEIQSSGTNLTNTGGSLNVNVTNGAAATTGSAVPADASYTGFNSGGNLVGVSSTNPLPVTVIGAGSGGGDTQYETGQLSGAATTGTVAMGTYGSGASTYATPLSVSSTGVLKVDGSGVTQPVSGTISANIESDGTPITNTSGALDVNIKGGTVPNTQYAAGAAAATPTGTVAMGTDGANARALSTTATGVLNVNVASTNNALSVVQSTAANFKATVLNQDGAGNALTSTSGALDVNLKSSGATIPVSIGGTPAVTVSGTPTVSISGTPAVTATVVGTVVSKAQDGSGNALTSTSGALDVNIKSGGAGGTQYAAGAAVATPTGTVALGTDGTDVRALKTDTSGRLNVVIAGSSVTQTVQLQGASFDSANNLNVNVVGGSVLNSSFVNGDGSAYGVYPLSCALHGFCLTNLTSAPVYVEFFNTGSPSLGSSTVVFCIVIPANGNVTIPPTATGLQQFPNGLGFGAVTTENGSTSAAVTGMIFYK